MSVMLVGNIMMSTKDMFPGAQFENLVKEVADIYALTSMP
jgi:hypothetical protein